MGSAGAAELFFVVAFTDAVGAEAMLERIQKRFNAPEGTLPAGLALSATYQLLEAIARNASGPSDLFLEKTSTGIHALMNQEMSSRMVGNAQ
jgi:hypothetical protein